MLAKLAKYNKLVVALVGAVVTVLLNQYSDVEWLQALVPFLTAAGVYQVANRK